MVVFLLLGVIWAAVLIPPWLQGRREARPIASMMSFRSQLWSLQRATPNYGLDAYRAYDDDDEELDSEGADVHAFDLQRRAGATVAAGPVAAAASGVAPGVVGAVVRPPSVAHGGRPASALAAAAVQRRALTYRRRRRILAELVGLSLAGIAPAVLLGTPWIVAEAVAVLLLAAYLGLLVRRGRIEAERARKVRYLSPIRAPRPAVVIIGSGAAR